MIDEARALKIAVDTGKVVLGARGTRRAAKKKQARLIVLAQNCQDADLKTLAGVKVHVFPGTNVELGAACGLPFAVSAVAVVDPGESNILSV